MRFSVLIVQLIINLTENVFEKVGGIGISREKGSGWRDYQLKMISGKRDLRTLFLNPQNSLKSRLDFPMGKKMTPLNVH